MTFTYDTTTDLGKVRLLCRDTVEATAVFTDAEITAYLDLADDYVKLAAALALEDIASDNSRLANLKKLNNIEFDGVAVSKDLRARAAALRADYYREKAEEEGLNLPAIDLVPLYEPDPGY